jgi:hypothetical protein
VYKVICDFGKTEYFFRRDWTGRNSLIRLEKLGFTRKTAGRSMKPAGRGDKAHEGDVRHGNTVESAVIAQETTKIFHVPSHDQLSL